MYCVDVLNICQVQFQDEEAQDDGGVRKEFFLLLMRELLNPNYGMFTEYADSRTIWFSENTFEEKDMYCLVGKEFLQI